MENNAGRLAGALNLKASGAHHWRGDCPACGYRGAFALSEREQRRALFWCANCRDGSAILDALKRRDIWSGSGVGSGAPDPTAIERIAERDRQRQERAARMSAIAARDWQAAKPITGTVGERYLREVRGIRGTLPPSIRFSPAAVHSESGLRLPAVVCGAACWPSRNVVAIHRTFLRSDGSGKAPVTPDRKTLGPVAGASIRLAPAAPAMAVGEGLETCLSVADATGLATWAAMFADNILALALPDLPLASDLVIAADHDENGVGQKAAEAAAERWARQGRRVRIALPPRVGTDFNDMARAVAHV
ncbi:MAG: toprim domain-containing protein [Rhodospirillales bacterium]|nr:toprim domain-containing protein [Rhodospirillales bacterium]